MKVKDILKKEANNLKNNNIEDEILKSRILLGYILNLKSEELIFHIEDEVSEDNLLKYKMAICRLINGEPIQYITKSQSFYGLDFYVDENVLIPQPDTEILVKEVIDIAKKINKKIKILDMCTGSGAIAISLAKNLENAEVIAGDISLEALKITEKNAQNNNIKIKLLYSDMFKNINEKFDIIVSNPPYIESEVIKKLSKEVQNEPQLALDGGEDGLKFYRILANEAKKYLNDNGILAVEIGYNQKEKVMELFEKNNFIDIYSKKDFGDNDRIVVGKWGNN